MIQLGDKVHDTITGIDGIVVARTEWLHRSAQFCIARQGVGQDGRPFDEVWFDEGRLLRGDAA